MRRKLVAFDPTQGVLRASPPKEGIWEGGGGKGKEKGKLMSGWDCAGPSASVLQKTNFFFKISTRSTAALCVRLPLAMHLRAAQATCTLAGGTDRERAVLQARGREDTPFPLNFMLKIESARETDFRRPGIRFLIVSGSRRLHCLADSAGGVSHTERRIRPTTRHLQA